METVKDRQLSQQIIDVLSAEHIAFDVEHDPSLNAWDNDFSLWGCSFASDKGAVYLTDNEEILAVCRQYFTDASKTFVAHNAQYDVMCLTGIGLEPENQPVNLACTMLAMNVLYETLRENQLGLKYLVKKMFDHQMMEYAEAFSYGQDSQEFLEYALEDSRWTIILWDTLRPKLIEEGQYKYLVDLLGQASIVFADMTYNGIMWDDVKAQEMRAGFELVQYEAEQRIKAVLGSDFNINSADQVAHKLFVDPNGLRLPTRGVKMTESGKRFQADEKTLLKFEKKHPVCRDILIYKTAKKYVTTYINPLTAKSYEDIKGRVRCRFMLHSSTGRTRAEKPALQTIPARYKTHTKDFFGDLFVRKCFVSEKGWKYCVADLSQIELRIIGLLTKEPAIYGAYLDWFCNTCGEKGESEVILHECPNCGESEQEPKPKKGIKGKFWHGRDLHQEQADAIPELHGNRDAGKVTNFSLVYNVQAKRLLEEGVAKTLTACQNVRDKYLASKPKLRAWHTATEVKIRSVKCLTDLFGRKRRFTNHDLSNDHYWHAKNQGINFVPQASAVAMSLLALIKMRRAWIQSGDWNTNVRLLNFVHDEINLEIREEHSERLSKDLVYHMEHACHIGVPIRAEVSLGDNWKECK